MALTHHTHKNQKTHQIFSKVNSVFVFGSGRHKARPRPIFRSKTVGRWARRTGRGGPDAVELNTAARCQCLSRPGLAGQLVNKFKPAARGTCLSRRRGPWSSHIFKLPAPECARDIRPSVVESRRPMRTGLSSSKKQEIKKLRRRADGLKEGHAHPRLSGEKNLFFFIMMSLLEFDPYIFRS
jgi:hypothetical protein